MERICAPELLDELPADDPGAIGSRRDLRRLNWVMGNAGKMAAALNRCLPRKSCLDMLEIGGGDGEFLGDVLRQLSGSKEGSEGLRGQGCPRSGTATLLDQQELLTEATARRIRAVGWELKAIKSDVFDWCRQNAARFDAIVANLFLHHFSNEELVELFEAIASRTNLLVAVEPHRGRMSLLAGKFLWAIGCNSVTRHDAVVSIRAGFYGSELTALWPKVGDWRCEERQEGFSSHVFVARKAAESG